jgi:serine/threonine protein kinase
MARLVWKRQGSEGKAFSLGEQATVGRDASLDCVLDVKSVSRKHAKIERRDAGFFIADLGSTNGTIVNGVRIGQPTRLGPGDRIQLGDEVLEFQPESSPPPAATGQLTRGSAETAPLDQEALAARIAGTHGPGVKQEARLPRRAGKFYLLKRLGLGGMGTVYQAIDLDSNREVAVKFIRSSIGRHEAFLDFFHNREAVLAREINHANVIRVFEHGVDAEQHFISMEYVPGKNLYHVMKERNLEPVEVLEVLRQVACGLVAAHRQGVVHSDIKPANILLVGETSAPVTGSGNGSSGGSTTINDDSDAILEFESEAAPRNDGPAPSLKYDAGLLEEIRRRVGEPSRDVVVDPPYFARQSETSFLSHYLEKIVEGHGYFLLVEGELGTGKSRLISELLKETRRGAGPERFRLFELDCSRIEGLPLLYEQLFEMKVAGNALMRHISEEVVRRISEDPSPKVIRLLNLGTAIPVACDLIQALVGWMPKIGLLLIGGLVPGEMRENGSLKLVLERAAAFTKELYLRPLTEYQIQRYLQQIFRDALTGLDLAADVYKLSGGNFAKLLEILRGFFDRGLLTLDKPSGRLLYRPRQQELELEEGKNFYEKYRSYGKIEQHVLEQAAFIGSRFIFDTLLKLHDINETSLYFIVRTLLAEGFFVEEGRTWYGFTNTAFQRYMAERIPESERPHLHRKVSRLLQTVPVPESPELHQLRARHLAGCHEYAKAVQALLEGAHLARCEYRVDLSREMVQEILRIYRLLARRETARREMTGILRDWFRKDGNWYEILGELGSDEPVAKVKIADFGISFRLKDEERGYQLEKRPVLGTPRYMAPERGKGEYGGFKSDIFSLGVITYEMMMGEPPFPELKGGDVIQANREMRISLSADALQRFPPGTDALLAGMVEKDPRRRWDAERVVREVVKLQLDLRAMSGR